MYKSTYTYTNVRQEKWGKQGNSVIVAINLLGPQSVKIYFLIPLHTLNYMIYTMYLSFYSLLKANVLPLIPVVFPNYFFDSLYVQNIYTLICGLHSALPY